MKPKPDVDPRIEGLRALYGVDGNPPPPPVQPAASIEEARLALEAAERAALAEEGIPIRRPDGTYDASPAIRWLSMQGKLAKAQEIMRVTTKAVLRAKTIEMLRNPPDNGSA